LRLLDSRKVLGVRCTASSTRWLVLATQRHRATDAASLVGQRATFASAAGRRRVPTRCARECRPDEMLAVWSASEHTTRLSCSRRRAPLLPDRMHSTSGARTEISQRSMDASGFAMDWMVSSHPWATEPGQSWPAAGWLRPPPRHERCIPARSPGRCTRFDVFPRRPRQAPTQASVRFEHVGALPLREPNPRDLQTTAHFPRHTVTRPVSLGRCVTEHQSLVSF
jgi:hypothetical protein